MPAIHAAYVAYIRLLGLAAGWLPVAAMWVAIFLFLQSTQPFLPSNAMVYRESRTKMSILARTARANIRKAPHPAGVWRGAVICSIRGPSHAQRTQPEQAARVEASARGQLAPARLVRH